MISCATIVQRIDKKWSYTKYDAFGRVTETGIYTNSTIGSRQVAIDSLNIHKLNNIEYHWEERSGVNYSNRSFPTSSGKKAYVINYYDDYTFNGATTATLQAVGITKSEKTKTLLTGTRVSKYDGTSPLLTIHYYDDRARLIQSASENHLTGTDYVTNTYSFVGELLTSKREHKASANGTVTTLLTKNEYDHVGRLVNIKHKVNNQDTVLLSRNEYNEIGQLKGKKLHSENKGTTFIHTTSYSYNERGWTTQATSPNFSYELKYNTGTIPQYNGNISQQLWGHASTTPNIFNYSYDKLNRLAKGVSGTGSIMYERMEYDERGNIKKLVRNGNSLSDTTATNYAYENNNLSNRLTSITKGSVTSNYTYDVNGNATKDRTGMSFTYNHLNLPKTANKTGTSVSYLYDAMGSKLRKTAVEGSNTTVRDYVGGIEYAGGNIEMIHTGEGYLQRNSNNTYTYHYNLIDHLGNVRATLHRATATTGTVIQKHDYYPFGKSKALAVSGINKYLYNGKEPAWQLMRTIIKNSFPNNYSRS